MSALDVLLQIAQVITVLALAPLIQSIIAQFEKRARRAQGPGVFQPYRDLRKFFRSRSSYTRPALGCSGRPPVIDFTCMLAAPNLIPVPTNFPLHGQSG
jgi:formate hydrogenlyase subunit 4